MITAILHQCNNAIQVTAKYMDYFRTCTTSV